MEAYVFADIGAWRSLEELENSLVLKELLLFVSACRRSDFKNLKMMGMAQGAEVQLDDDDYGFEGASGQARGQEAASGFELTHLPVSLGYEKEVPEVVEPTKIGVTELIESRIAESEAQYIKTDDEED